MEMENGLYHENIPITLLCVNYLCCVFPGRSLSHSGLLSLPTFKCVTAAI